MDKVCPFRQAAPSLAWLPTVEAEEKGTRPNDEEKKGSGWEGREGKEEEAAPAVGRSAPVKPLPSVTG